jgi:hypothetical protein
VAASPDQHRRSGEYGQNPWQTHQAMLSWAAPSAITGRDLILYVLC